MRWFYVPNEYLEGDQVGPRMAFEKLHAEGVLYTYEVYSYLMQQQRLQDHETALNELPTTTRNLGPDVIFFQHLFNDFPMDRAFLQKLSAIPNKPLWK